MNTANFEQHKMNPIEELMGEIEYLNDEYRQGTPQVSDQYYDSLLEKLAELDPTNSLLQKGVIEKSKKTSRERRLPVPMYSLEKEKSVAAIREWLYRLGLSDDTAIVLTPKFNGVSLLADYTIHQLSTRGDGEIGQSCDKHFMAMSTAVDEDFEWRVVGEAIISRANWKEHFEGKLAPSGMPYRLNNATVAGMLNADEPPEAIQYVDFVKYTLPESTFSKDVQLDIINRFSETPTDYCLIRIKDLTEEYLDYFYKRNNLVYPIDGIVIDINERHLRLRFGRESNGNPAYARALKLDKWVEEFDTVLTGYDFGISKQGRLKGVVTFEPVFINGTEVKQATFYNGRFLHDFNLYPKVHVKVKKSGEIIPKIVEVEGVRVPQRDDFKNEGDYEVAYTNAIGEITSYREARNIQPYSITHCPSCDFPLSWDINEVELMCPNDECPEMKLSKMEHFFLTLGVEEFGLPSITTLYANGYDTIEKIWGMQLSQIEAIDGFGEVSARLILNQFAKIQTEGIPLARLLYAYDVFDGKIGEKTAQLILDETDELGKWDIVSLSKIKGVSDLTAHCFIQGFNRYLELHNMVKMSYVKSPRKEVTGDRFVGWVICFSGVRDHDLEKVIEENGGKVVDSVSKKTTHLVVADLNQSTGKTVKAKELNIFIVTLDEFKTKLV